MDWLFIDGAAFIVETSLKGPEFVPLSQVSAVGEIWKWGGEGGEREGLSVCGKGVRWTVIPSTALPSL